MPGFIHTLLCTGVAVSAVTGPVAAPGSTLIALQHIEIGQYTAGFDPVTHTLVSLAPSGADDFDFLPADRYEQRNSDGFYHLGDIDLRLRAGSDRVWRDYSSALRRTAVRPLPTEGDELLAGDISDSLGADVTVERRWLAKDGALVLRYTLRNDRQETIEIGGLGIPMVFNNIISDRSLEEAHARVSFADPYIGLDAGYVQVTRLDGQGPALLVLPDGSTPLEAWKPILDRKNADGSPVLLNDPTPRGITFEGFHSWMIASRGFADQEWRGAAQWNPATSLTIEPGAHIEFGLRFVTAPSIRDIEATLSRHDRPVAVGIPGYVVPMDLDVELFIKAGAEIRSLEVSPARALAVTRSADINGWYRLAVAGRRWGRARLDIEYANGMRQSVHYFVTKPASDAVADLGRFLFEQQWYDTPDDPFGRAPAIMSYDHDAGAIVQQEERVWIAGLSDEGGAGSWLAAIMKQLGQPDPAELAKFERFVTETLDGQLQLNEGDNRYGVRKSLFFYDPDAMPGVDYDADVDWSLWSAWDKAHASLLNRSFNYVHVAAAHWVLYRLARFHEGLVLAHDWRWYLERASNTALAMVRLAPHYAQFGQMEGSVYVEILRALRREGMEREALAMEAVMQSRAARWRKQTYPFGSEMPWDSTGQEEVYAWMRYFGDDNKATITREVILGYDPTVPHWGYNGSARRYWDFRYAGKLMRIERQLHHYGSANNAIPLFDSYRRDPADIHLLRVAYGGLLGMITNIHQDGFGSAAFHSFPDTMRFDAYSGDYGTGFFGHAFATASYLLEHPEFGWVAFGGRVSESGAVVSLVPKDSFRTRVFVAPAGLWLTLDAGQFQRVDYDQGTGAVALLLAPANAFTPRAWLNLETTVQGQPAYRPVSGTSRERGAYVIELRDEATLVDLEKAQ